MHGSIEEHIETATLEDYSLRRLGPEAVGAVEGHLLVCARCRDWLAGIEPFNSIHYTEDGPFYSRITLLQDGSLWAHHWGCEIDGGGRYRDRADACKYLRDAFEQMFPEHECGDECGEMTRNPNARRPGS